MGGLSSRPDFPQHVGKGMVNNSEERNTSLPIMNGFLYENAASLCQKMSIFKDLWVMSNPLLSILSQIAFHRTGTINTSHGF